MRTRDERKAARPRKKRRVFLWVFLGIQALFLAWVIYGASISTAPPPSQVASACFHHAWWPLFKSQADCVTHYGGALTSAGDSAMSMPKYYASAAQARKGIDLTC